MLLDFCKLSDSLLSFISMNVISSAGLLEYLVSSESYLSKNVMKKLHELLLKLLVEPSFKYEFAKEFLKYYPTMVNEAIKKENFKYEFAKELLKYYPTTVVNEAIEKENDILSNKYPLVSTFSVQIFTVTPLTLRLVKEENLLATLFGCLGNIFVASAGEDGRLETMKWRNFHDLTIRVVKDIQFVISLDTVPRYIIHEQRALFRTWARLLAFVQGMESLHRETEIHVEDYVPFFVCHSIENIHSLLVGAAFDVSRTKQTDDESLFNMSKQDIDDGDNLRHAKMRQLSEESCVRNASGKTSVFVCERKASGNEADKVGDLQVPESVTWLTYECLRAIENWLGFDDSTSGTVSDTFSSNSSHNPITNFLAFRRTLSTIRKGKTIFGRLTGSTESQSRQHLLAINSDVGMDAVMENSKSMSQDSKIITRDAAPSSSSISDDSTVEGDHLYVPECNPLRILSLSEWPDIMYNISSLEASVFFPLHRLLSLLLRNVLRRCGGCEVPNTDSRSLTIHTDLFGDLLRGCHPVGFSAFIMEHPLRARVFCAQVHSGMWRKNGDTALLSCEWYYEDSWSEDLESDLFLLQLCAALAPADLYVERILGRFGLSKYLSLNLEKSSEYEPALVREMLTLIIQIVQERRFCGLITAQSVKRELIYELAISDATHSQLVKSLPCDLSKCDQLKEILDTVAIYTNPSGFSEGMYSLRWTCWKELDLYHPRWISRDLQAAEERYMRFCGVSPLSTQLPRWTNIYPPLKGVARVATCKSVLQIIRAVLFYAVYTNKSTDSRASDGVVTTALHLLSLALDICFQQRESGELIPLLAFAAEETRDELKKGATGNSLLSLLVILMRMHKKENLDSVGSFNLSSFIESLVQKFAGIDSGCMTKLQQLAPELVGHVLQSS